MSEVYKKANELKMIIYNNSDFKFAEKRLKKLTHNVCCSYNPSGLERFDNAKNR